MKKLFLVLISFFILACEKPPVEYVRMVSMPYCLTNENLTKVSYDGGTYSFQDNDQLYIKGVNRDDISGTLYWDGFDKWSGNLFYNEIKGEPVVGEELSILMIHGDNGNVSEYSNKVVYKVPNGYSGGLLQYAVENYSKFTSSIEFGDTTVVLHQTSCFLAVNININFLGIGRIVEGETSVEVIPSDSTYVDDVAELTQIDDTHYSSNFIVVMPGGVEISAAESVIKVCDRGVSMLNKGTKTLIANNKYTINRTINFKPELGDPYWSDGTYGRISHQSGVDVVGIIVYVNADDSDIAKALTEYDNGGGHALVAAVHNSDTEIKWGKRGVVYTSRVRSPSASVDTANVSGYNNSTIIGINSDAVVSAIEYRGDYNDDHSNDTGWFLPSVGQWIFAVGEDGFCKSDPMSQWITTNSDLPWITNGSFGNLILVKEGYTDDNILAVSLNNRLEVLKQHLGCDYDPFGMWIGSDYSDSYWTSTEYDTEKAIRMNLGSVEKKNKKYYSSIKVAFLDRSSTWAWKEGFILKVRPFLAF